MKRFLLFFLLVISASCLLGQENYVLETRFRNPIDTVKFHKTPTMLLFVHSKCQHGHLCPTTRMQKALESDTFGFINRFGIRLYVIYRYYSQNDINTFDSFSPIVNAKVAFYTNINHQGTFGEGGTTPYIVFYDGKGHVHTQRGGTIEELNDSVSNKWRYVNEKCPVCNGTGSVKPNRLSHDPDLSVGICRRCSGGILGRKELY